MSEMGEKSETEEADASRRDDVGLPGVESDRRITDFESVEPGIEVESISDFTSIEGAHRPEQIGGFDDAEHFRLEEEDTAEERFQELSEHIFDHTRPELARAWNESDPGNTPAFESPTRREQGGWIVENREGIYQVHRWPAGEAASIQPTAPPEGSVASFHTHPTGPLYGEARPSDADVRWVMRDPDIRSPHFVVSFEGTFVIRPDGSYEKIEEDPFNS